MGFIKKFTAYDNSDRTEFYDDRGQLQTTHVERYGLDGKYKCTDVYNNKNERINRFKEKK